MLDWDDPLSNVSAHFIVKECLWLPSWNRLATADDGLNEDIKNNLIDLCSRMDIIRQYLNSPIKVHCAYRPSSYSVAVGGSATDPHTKGMAIDFDCMPNMDCDKIKEMLMPCLEQWDVRLEDNGAGAGWVHVDTAPIVYNRFFKP